METKNKPGLTIAIKIRELYAYFSERMVRHFLEMSFVLLPDVHCDMTIRGRGRGGGGVR